MKKSGKVGWGVSGKSACLIFSNIHHKISGHLKKGCYSHSISSHSSSHHLEMYFGNNKQCNRLKEHITVLLRITPGFHLHCDGILEERDCYIISNFPWFQ